VAPNRSLFGAVVGLVVLVFVVLLLSVVSLRDDTTQGRQSTDLLTASYGAEVALGEVSSSLRGWLIDPSPQQADAFKQSEQTLVTQLGTLRVLALGAGERGRVSALTAGVDRFLVNFANPLAGRSRGLSERQEVAAVSNSAGYIGPLSRQFTSLDNIEVAARQQRRGSLASGTSRTITIAAIGLAGSMLLLALLGTYMLRGILRPIRRVAEELERWGRGELSGRVSEGGRGEVAMLGRSFNHMADQLERRTTELSDANRRLERAVTQAQEASRMKSDFLANMSHEIRTPLNGVVGMVTLLSGTRLSGEQREYVEMARSSSDTLISVVSDILDVSKIEAGRLEMEQRDFDLHELIRATRDMLVQEAGRKGLYLHAGVADDVPAAVHGDRLRVGQVLGNLLANAVKFTADGEVVLEASVAERTSVATVVRFTVRDTGIGIAEARLGTLFDPFIQADTSTTRIFGGTGLGLTISRDLSRLMGGTISARSELGKGSTFEVLIPFAPAVGEIVVAPPAVELRGLRVLVVDDNPANRKILETYVASWGMRSTSAGDAAQALSQLLDAADEGEPFDVALLDVKMPGGSGIELAQRIDASPRLRGTRLILLSSVADGIAELGSHGIRQRLVKPISQSMLLDAIGAAMHDDLPATATATATAPATATATAPGTATARAPATATATAGATATATATAAGAASDRLATEPEPVDPVAPARTGRARILVAEDNFVNRMFVERLLSQRGYDVTTVLDGRQVLSTLDTSAFHLILMDCQMPELDGYDTTREIRRQEAAGGTRRIPIIAMTAAATGEIRQKCLDAGMDDYLSKPLVDEDLQAALDRGLGEEMERRTLDRARVARLREMFDDEEPGAVLVRLAHVVTDELDRARALAQAGDHDGLARVAHSIRGSGQMIGATSLVSAAAELERRASEDGNDHRTVKAGLEVLAVSWVHTRAQLEAEVSSEREKVSGVSSEHVVD
jgi:two-component system sensor histidine kinase/response regulator